MNKNVNFVRNQPFNDLPLLPPSNIKNEDFTDLLLQAVASITSFNATLATIEDPMSLLYVMILMESQRSSEVENIHTTLEEIYQYQETINSNNQRIKINPNAKEVDNYIKTISYAYRILSDKSSTITTQLLIEMVNILKDDRKLSIRDNSNNKTTRVGDYMPPHGEYSIREKLDNLIQFINGSIESSLHPLVKMAIIHYQFEAIHPFEDGNGRIGRILNILYLIEQGLLSHPVLYLSQYIVKYKYRYYDLLLSVSEENNWHQYIEFMLKGIIEVTNDGYCLINLIKLKEDELISQYKEMFHSNTEQIMRFVLRYGCFSLNNFAKTLSVSLNTARKYIKQLQELQIVCWNPDKKLYTTDDIIFQLIVATAEAVKHGGFYKP